jgi:hypothetical protein
MYIDENYSVELLSLKSLYNVIYLFLNAFRQEKMQIVLRNLILKATYWKWDFGQQKCLRPSKVLVCLISCESKFKSEIYNRLDYWTDLACKIGLGCLLTTELK